MTHAPQDFVLRTQIMNEGWAMYWEKKIMLELFEERAVTGIIDYARVFSNVCRPRPYFQRNPYHLGYNLWRHIEQLYRDGKVSLDYREEIDHETRRRVAAATASVDPIAAMSHLVDTVTDYEFLRRFLTPALVHELHLNRIERRIGRAARHQGGRRSSSETSATSGSTPSRSRTRCCGFYTHFHRPRIYVIDDGFPGRRLCCSIHRDDGRALRKDWIRAHPPEPESDLESARWRS